ncbi:HesA/MoeB/ThiF family protein [Methanooceanicella nereidis]|nr:ThiF family adenylyltransferase [Methanocella sp. CWC-04]
MMKSQQKFRVSSSKKQRKIDRNIRVVFPEPLYEAMSGSLINEEKASHECYILAQCGYKVDESKKNLTYMVKDLYIPGREDLLEQSSVTVTPKADFLEKIFSEAYENNSTIIEIHSHVDSKSPNFSWVDIDHGIDNGRFLRSCKIKFVMCVIGTEGFSIAEYDSDHDSLDLPKKAVISIMTRSGIKDVLPGETSTGSSIEISPVYDRQVLMWGKEGQERICNVCAGIVGLGGTGSVLLQMLARMGVKKFVLCDDDIIERSNLNRLPYTFNSDIGKKKIKAAQNYLKKLSKDIDTTLLNGKVQEHKEKLKGCDILFGCVDSEGARLILNEISLKYFIPYIDTGTEIFCRNADSGSNSLDMGGQVRVVIPSVTGCLECMGGIDKGKAEMDLLRPEEMNIREKTGYVNGTDITPVPSVISLNNMIASMAVQEFVDMVTGNGSRPKEYNYIKYDSVEPVLERMIFEKDPSCPMCGNGGILGAGDIKKQSRPRIKNIAGSG